jgi:hypothetical protein
MRRFRAEMMADRIQARAIRRCGKLLKISPANGANQNIREGLTNPKVTQESAATEASLSEHQRKTALRVANIDSAEFNRQVDGENPPTAMALFFGEHLPEVLHFCLR